MDRSFERLYRRHARDVYRYAYAVLRNQADAEDVTQTTFMNAYRALERGDDPHSPQHWLIAIAHNVCRQRFRNASRRPLEVALDEDVADTLVPAGDESTPTTDDIRRALQHLAFNQRAALVMRELEGRTYAEIADVLGLTVTAVETLIFRARRALREQLEESLTCAQAELAISRQLDGELARTERSQLRAHLRECAQCRTIARSQRAQRSALKALGAVPLPSSLASLFGGGGASVGAAVAAKAAAVVVAAGVATGIGVDVQHRLARSPAHHHRTVPAVPTAPAAQAPQSRHQVVEGAAVSHPAPARPRPRPRPLAVSARPRHAPAAHGPAAVPRPAPAPPAPAAATVPAAAPPPAHEAPGRAKHEPDAAAPAYRQPPGRAQREQEAAPPGQAKKQQADAAAPAQQPPGQAKKDARAQGRPQQPAPTASTGTAEPSPPPSSSAGGDGHGKQGDPGQDGPVAVPSVAAATVPAAPPVAVPVHGTGNGR